MKTNFLLNLGILIVVLSLTGCGLIDFRTDASWQEQAISGQNAELCLKATHPNTCLHSYVAATRDRQACTLMETAEEQIDCAKHG